MITKLSARTWVLTGFAISLLAVVINVFILSSINDRMGKVDRELAGLNTSLANQATDLTRTDVKGDLFLIMHHLSKLATDKDEHDLASADAINIMQEYLKKYYAAVNDIPLIELLKAENEDLSGQIKSAEKLKAAYAIVQKEGRTPEVERLFQEADEIEKQSAQTRSELGKRLDQSAKLTDEENLASKNIGEVMMEMLPSLKSSNEQYIASTEKKEARIKELRERKENLAGWQALFSYLAVSLQLFGLMFVMVKDLTKDTKERRAKAERQAGKVKETASRAEVDAAAVS